MFKTETRMFISHDLYIYNYEAKSDTEAVLHSREHTLVYCLKPILKVCMQTVFQIQVSFFRATY